ncbi:hypothetical protein KM043_015212 [Ampulex compressa]|nr:hypothetical protein KM043_015212 [Ampulex compressa]
MAALIRHGSLANPLKSTSALLFANTTAARRDITRFKTKKVVRKSYTKLEAAQKSLSTKGFLRSHKPYEPPKDVLSRIDTICERQNIPLNNDTKLEDSVTRFKVLVACEEDLKHSVPNSLLHSIETIGDLRKFYLTPVDTTTPFDALVDMELPKNLHIQTDYIRFHPDTDTLFNGKTAFPKSSTLVTGLKYKKKYPGHKQEDPFLEEMLKI